jgi:hypothetical protein
VTTGTTSNLNSWQPGGAPAAQAGIEDHGTGPALAMLSLGAGATAAALTASRIKDAAKALADGTAAGDTPHSIGAAMHAAMADPDRAYAAAVTETTRAIAAGAADGYRRSGVAHGRWQTEPDGRVCPVCEANAAAGTLPLGSTYPSGDAYPPAHPRCRCAVLPA